MSRKEVIRAIWNDFDVCRKYRSDPWMKGHEKKEKTRILGIPGSCVPVHFEHVPVHIVFWSFLAKVYRYTLGVYRYTPVLFSSFDQFLYFSHNLLISYPI